MYLAKLNIINFKNYSEQTLEFCPGLNCITGNNGMGKTNVLDAIHYLSFSKSFLNPIDSQNIKHNEPFFVIEGIFHHNNENDTVYCGMKRQEKKIFKRNKKQYSRIAEHIGLYPLVIISPADTELVYEGSEQRRKFIDTVISQFDQTYLDNLISYNKILSQRNALLKNIAIGKLDWETMPFWNEQLVSLGNKIHAKRKEFIHSFNDYFADFYSKIAGKSEIAGLKYDSQLSENNFDLILKNAEKKDLEREYTTVGIHKDDLLFTMNEHSVKKFASQGQQKTYLTALKLAEYEFLKKVKNVPPILLLDDIFDKLDHKRVEQIVKIVSGKSFGQIFITDTDDNRIKSILENINKSHKIFHIKNSEIYVEKA